MAPDNLLFIIILSAAWIFFRLKDKSLSLGAYSPGREYSRMSDAIALFGLFWLSFIPIGIVATIFMKVAGGNLFVLLAGCIIVGGLLYLSFTKTRFATKAPGLDALRNFSFSWKKDNGESIIPFTKTDKNTDNDRRRLPH